MHGRQGSHTTVLSSTALKTCMGWVSSLRSLFAIDARTYRPEKYYMRGPGPKWHEKHAGLFDGL
jgi:hypothetical protein